MNMVQSVKKMDSALSFSRSMTNAGPVIIYRPTCPTKQNRAAFLQKPPDINIISHLFSPVHSQFLQLFAFILMEHPILQFSRSGCIMKIQKRSESNVLSKLPINKIYRK